MKVYLAGPDVFLADAIAVGARKKALCAARGLEGLFPLDGGAAQNDPASIFRACMTMLRAADAGVFNLTPFRGTGADPGTAFEMGAMHALGRPLVAYTADERDLADRVRAVAGPVSVGPMGEMDRDGLQIEDFGGAENLMLTIPALDVVRRPPREGETALAALAAFEVALDRLCALARP
ncbi:MAG: nucleoside 2-deoxyribosyltransferase [Pseudomonadota bacterium]